jgi:hypothetical protein
MAWDKFRMAQKFLQKANAIHPEDADNAGAHDEALALQDVYYDCYMSSFSEQDLIKRLEEIIGGKIEMPEEGEFDVERYRSVYIKEARVVLGSIQRGDFR